MLNSNGCIFFFYLEGICELSLIKFCIVVDRFVNEPVIIEGNKNAIAKRVLNDPLYCYLSLTGSPQVARNEK